MSSYATDPQLTQRAAPQGTGTRLGLVALAVAMVGFLGWLLFIIAGLLAIKFSGEQSSDDQAMQFNLLVTCGFILSGIGPLVAFGLGAGARFSKGCSPRSRSLGLSAMIIACIQIVVAVGVPIVIGIGLGLLLGSSR